MKTKTHFAFRVDIWDDVRDSIVEDIAGAGAATAGAVGRAMSARELLVTLILASPSACLLMTTPTAGLGVFIGVCWPAEGLRAVSPSGKWPPG